MIIFGDKKREKYLTRIKWEPLDYLDPMVEIKCWDLKIKGEIRINCGPLMIWINGPDELYFFCECLGGCDMLCCDWLRANDIDHQVE